MDIYKEEKFDKGGIVLERIHPDLQVEPYVPYYERMGYVVSIVEKPNGWVELIGEKKDTFEDAYGRFKKDIRENTSPRKMAKGGEVSINPFKKDKYESEVIEHLVRIMSKQKSVSQKAEKMVSEKYKLIDFTLKTEKPLTPETMANVIANSYGLEPISKFAKGGRTKIENDGVDFNEQMYRGILGDRDKDGTENADDVEPNNPNVSKNIEGTKFTDTFRTLLGNKRTYDDSMYSIIGEMEKILPQKFDIIARTKTPFSILKKLVEKRLKFKRNEEGKVTNKGLTDVVGTTIATNNTKELMTLRKMIGVDNGDNGIFGEVIEVDDKFKIPACGYRAIHYIVLYNGVPVEIQLKTKRMKMLNEFSHPFYKAGDLDCDGMGELAEIVVMADNGSKEAQKEFTDIFADKERLRSMVSKSYARGGKFADGTTQSEKYRLDSLTKMQKLEDKGGEVEWFDYSKIDLEELPYELDRYFIKDADTKEIDLNLLEPTRAREKGVKNANKYMRMAYDGEIDRRKPISVYERNGEMYVFDGNSTIANAKNSGWKTIYVEMIDDPNEDYGKGGEITTWNWGGEPMLAFTKVDYDVNVNPSNLEVDVNIKESDSVDHYALNNSDAEWTQYSWGYMVYPKNEKQLYDVLKALRVSVSKQRLSDWFKSGGKSYARGGRTKDSYEIDDTILVKPKHASREDIKDLYEEIEDNSIQYKTFKAPNNEADYISITPDNFSERNRMLDYLDDESWDYEEFSKGGRTKDAKTLRETSSALRKASGMHKQQSEQLMGASSSHKKQAKNLDRIADKISKGYARGGEVYDETKYNANEEIISTKKTNISNIDTRLKPFLKDKERFKVEIKRDKEFNIVKVEVYQKNFNKWRLFKTYINKKEFARGGEIDLREYTDRYYNDASNLRGVKVYNSYSERVGYINDDEVSRDDIQRGESRIWVGSNPNSDTGRSNDVSDLYVLEDNEGNVFDIPLPFARGGDIE